jgi:hypothetical protein
VRWAPMAKPTPSRLGERRPTPYGGGRPMWRLELTDKNCGRDERLLPSRSCSSRVGPVSTTSGDVPTARHNWVITPNPPVSHALERLAVKCNLSSAASGYEATKSFFRTWVTETTRVRRSRPPATAWHPSAKSGQTILESLLTSVASLAPRDAGLCHEPRRRNDPLRSAFRRFVSRDSRIRNT